jgi:hypothetical protein
LIAVVIEYRSLELDDGILCSISKEETVTHHLYSFPDVFRLCFECRYLTSRIAFQALSPQGVLTINTSQLTTRCINNILVTW